MTRARILQEVRQMRFEEMYERRQRRTMTMAEATEMLEVTERTFRRWSGRYDAEGVGGCRIGGSAGSRPARCRSMRRCAG
jgi:transposase